jgi:hypothetical protein
MQGLERNNGCRGRMVLRRVVAMPKRHRCAKNKALGAAIARV